MDDFKQQKLPIVCYRSDGETLRASIIVLTVFAIGSIVVGLILTIIGYWAGYNPVGGSPLKIAGPVVLAIGVLCLIAILIIMAKEGRNHYNKKNANKSKNMSELPTITDSTYNNPAMAHMLPPNRFAQQNRPGTYTEHSVGEMQGSPGGHRRNNYDQRNQGSQQKGYHPGLQYNPPENDSLRSESPIIPQHDYHVNLNPDPHSFQPIHDHTPENPQQAAFNHARATGQPYPHAPSQSYNPHNRSYDREEAGTPDIINPNVKGSRSDLHGSHQDMRGRSLPAVPANQRGPVTEEMIPRPGQQPQQNQRPGIDLRPPGSRYRKQEPDHSQDPPPSSGNFTWGNNNDREQPNQRQPSNQQHGNQHPSNNRNQQPSSQQPSNQPPSSSGNFEWGNDSGGSEKPRPRPRPNPDLSASLDSLDPKGRPPRKDQPKYKRRHEIEIDPKIKAEVEGYKPIQPKDKTKDKRYPRTSTKTRDIHNESNSSRSRSKDGRQRSRERGEGGRSRSRSRDNTLDKRRRRDPSDDSQLEDSSHSNHGYESSGSSEKGNRKKNRKKPEAESSPSTPRKNEGQVNIPNPNNVTININAQAGSAVQISLGGKNPTAIKANTSALMSPQQRGGTPQLSYVDDKKAI